MTGTTKSFLSLCAADIMSRQIVMIPRAMSLQAAARSLARAGVSGAPVVDDDGHCIGVISTTDFMHWVENGHESESKARAASEPMSQAWQIPECASLPGRCIADAMTKDPVLVFAGTRIAEMARMMMDAHIHRLIVVDAGTQRPIGVVSSTDILAALARDVRAHATSEAEPSRECASALMYEEHSPF